MRQMVLNNRKIGRIRKYQTPARKRRTLEEFVRGQLNNLLGGMFRGFGVAIGFTLLAAIMIMIMSYIVQWNLPYISEFIAKVLKMVEFNLEGHTSIK